MGAAASAGAGLLGASFRAVVRGRTQPGGLGGGGMGDMGLLSFFVGLDSCDIAGAGDVDRQEIEGFGEAPSPKSRRMISTSVEEKVKVAEYPIGSRGRGSRRGLCWRARAISAQRSQWGEQCVAPVGHEHCFGRVWAGSGRGHRARERGIRRVSAQPEVSQGATRGRPRALRISGRRCREALGPWGRRSSGAVTRCAASPAG